MNKDAKFTQRLQDWMNTPDPQKNWDEGALLLLQLTGNRIMYNNISVNPKGKAEFIKGQLQKFLNFRLADLTHAEVESMQAQVDEIVKNVIKPKESSEFVEFKAGKRSDHDDLPDEIKALYAENLDIVHKMRELHLRLRTMSSETSTCPDSDRYPFLKELISLDKTLRSNWETYDHYTVESSPATESTAELTPEPTPSAEPAKAEVLEPAQDSTNTAAGEPAKPVKPKKASKSSKKSPTK